MKSADFFDGSNHPQLTFVSKKIEAVDDDNYTIHGDLTIRGVTQPIKLNAELGGIGKDPWGNEKAGFTVTGKINRTDYKLNWNAALEAGGVLVGDEVKINADVQLIKS